MNLQIIIVDVLIHDALAKPDKAKDKYSVTLSEFEDLPPTDILVIAVGIKCTKKW